MNRVILSPLITPIIHQETKFYQNYIHLSPEFVSVFDMNSKVGLQKRLPLIYGFNYQY